MFVLRALYLVLCALCIVHCALCFVPCALCLVLRALALYLLLCASYREAVTAQSPGLALWPTLGNGIVIYQPGTGCALFCSRLRNLWTQPRCG